MSHLHRGTIGHYKNITSWYVYLRSMTFMPCGIFMRRFSSVVMHLDTVPPTFVAYLIITFKVSEARIDFFHCSQNSKRFLKNAIIYSYKLRTNRSIVSTLNKHYSKTAQVT